MTEPEPLTKRMRDALADAGPEWVSLQTPTALSTLRGLHRRGLTGRPRRRRDGTGWAAKLTTAGKRFRLKRS